MSPEILIIIACLAFALTFPILSYRRRSKEHKEWEARKHEAGAPNRNYMWNLIVEAFPEAREIEVFHPQDGLDLHEEPRLIGARVILDGDSFHLCTRNARPDISKAVRDRKVKYDQKRLMHWIPKV